MAAVGALKFSAVLVTFFLRPKESEETVVALAVQD